MIARADAKPEPVITIAHPNCSPAGQYLVTLSVGDLRWRVCLRSWATMPLPAARAVAEELRAALGLPAEAVIVKERL